MLMKILILLIICCVIDIAMPSDVTKLGTAEENTIINDAISGLSRISINDDIRGPYGLTTYYEGTEPLHNPRGEGQTPDTRRARRSMIKFRNGRFAGYFRHTNFAAEALSSPLSSSFFDPSPSST